MSHEIQTRGSKTSAGINKRCSRNTVEDGGLGCSGKSCQSCTGRVIADCLAVCCCPCAVVNFFALAFLKLPWMMGRKCLGYLGKKHKRKKLQNEGKEGISRKEHGQNADLGKVITIEEDDDEEDESGSCKYSARFEAERVWLELYRVDNLGFGRVSFSGIQSLG